MGCTRERTRCRDTVWCMVELREFTLADGPLLTAWIDGPADLLMWAGPTFTWPLDPEQLAAYAAESSTGGRLTWMGCVPGTGEVIGHASLRLDAAQPTARLGRVLVAPEARGRGYGAAMLERVLTTAFADLGLQRIELGVFAHNTSAVRLYERLGFTPDRLLPDVEQIDGQSWSALQMSLPKSTWPTTN